MPSPATYLYLNRGQGAFHASKVMTSTTSTLKGHKLLSDYVSPQILSYLGAGGIAGAASRTVVSPLERIKIIQSVIYSFFVKNYCSQTRDTVSFRQVQSQTSGDTQYKGVWRSLVRIWNEEGFSGFMRGNMCSRTPLSTVCRSQTLKLS